jgi:hypothetical protein
MTRRKAPHAGDPVPDRASWAVPRFTLTDEQRKVICRLSGIPATVADDLNILNNPWSMIEVVSTTYLSRKKRESIALRPSEIKAELQAISDDAAVLWKRLRDFTERLPVDLNCPFPDGILAGLFDLQASCSLYEGDIESGKGGPSTRDVYTLVGILDGIRQEFSAKKISRKASKHYIVYVCKLVDPDIGSRTIDGAMEKIIARRRANQSIGKTQRPPRTVRPSLQSGVT